MAPVLPTIASLVLLLAGTPAPVRVERPHYELLAEAPVAEAEEYGDVLEAAWPLFRDFFGAEPELKKGEKLRVRFRVGDLDVGTFALPGTVLGLALQGGVAVFDEVRPGG